MYYVRCSSNTREPLAKFRAAASVTPPDETLTLVVNGKDGVDVLTEILMDPLAHKIGALDFDCGCDGEPMKVAPLLSACPNLVWLKVAFMRHSMIDFASDALECCPKIKELHTPWRVWGDSQRFFAALERSRVESLICAFGYGMFLQGLCSFLARDRLVSLEVFSSNEQVPDALVRSLAGCTRLERVKFVSCRPRILAFPASVVKLSLTSCKFEGEVELGLGGVRELHFHMVSGLRGGALGRVLGELDSLSLSGCNFTNDALAVMDLGRIRHLDLSRASLDERACVQIARGMRGGRMKALQLEYFGDMDAVDKHVVPATKLTDCTLTKLRLRSHKDRAQHLERQFKAWVSLHALLLGHRRRGTNPLRRLPVEMYRLVGGMLI